MNKLKDFGKRILNKIIREFIARVTDIKPNRIIFVQDSYSGSNTYALWKLANEAAHNKYELVHYQNSTEEGKGFKHFWKKYRLISSARLIVTTHASYKPGPRNIHLQLWHGALIKKNGVMLKEAAQSLKSPWPQVDYIMSYSETYTTFLNACMFVDPNKYVVTGAPRNDFLFCSDGFSNIRKIFGQRMEGHRLIFFLPTFRDFYGKSQGTRNYNNPFGFKEFLSETFDQFLTKNKIIMIFKPHPHEEALVLDYFKKFPLKNMLILKDEDLVTHGLDLYELLNAAELLITDYSSIFYDYLLLDRPMIFAPVDMDAYKQARGFLVESFDTWSSGPKVSDQTALQQEIEKCFAQKDYYKEQRTWVRNLMHRYKDGESARRLWEFIDGLLTK